MIDLSIACRYGIDDCVGAFVSAETLELEERLWVNQPSNFDNIGQSMFALYEIMTLDEWINVAYNGIDAVGVDRQPSENYFKIVLVYFLAFIVVCNFLFLNLFIGVIYEEYVTLKNAGLMSLTAGQKAWYNVQMAVSHVKPQVRAVMAAGKVSAISLTILDETGCFSVLMFLTVSVNLLLPNNPLSGSSVCEQNTIRIRNLSMPGACLIDCL